ncbi:MAG: DUF1573 domain-containing protein [Gemmataceae bacterium]
MARRTLIQVFAAGLCTWAGYWLVASRSYSVIRANIGSLPLLECPGRVEMGAGIAESAVDVRFTIANRGGGTLAVTRVVTNCSCTGLSRIVDGRRARVSAMDLSPGECADVVLNVPLKPTASGSLTSHVTLHTNDPDKPVHVVEAVVTDLHGGVFAAPATASFGAVKVGVRVAKVVSLLDSGMRSRQISRVSSSDPSVVTVELNRDGGVQTSPRDGFRQLGTVTIGVVPVTTGRLSANVLVEFDGDVSRQLAIPVEATAPALVEAHPSTLTVPRRSNAGPVYSATVLFKSSASDVTFLDAACPTGLKFEALSTVNAQNVICRVTWDPVIGSALSDNNHPIPVRLRAGATETSLEVLVRCIREEQ